LAFGLIIVGIVVYTVHLPKTATELNVADGKVSEHAEEPVTLMSFSYQNGGNVSAVEAHVTSHDTDNTCTDQLMCVSTS